MTVIEVIGFWVVYVAVTYVVHWMAAWMVDRMWWWYVDKVPETREPEGTGDRQDHIEIDANPGRGGTAEPTGVLVPGTRIDSPAPVHLPWVNCRQIGSVH